MSRGDRNRNARLARLRALVPAANAIVGIDLADNKQMVVLTAEQEAAYRRTVDRITAMATLSDPLSRWAMGTRDRHQASLSAPGRQQ